MRNPTTISLGATGSTLLLDLGVSLGAMGHVCSFRVVNYPGVEGTDLSRVKSGGVEDVNIIHFAGEEDTPKSHCEINIILWGKIGSYS